MARTAGSNNIKSFESRDTLATTSGRDIRHLARQSDLTPRAQFEALLVNQKSYLSWIDSRHSELLDAKKLLKPEGRGPKDAVYRKYKWYAEQQSLLEAINGFEVFYKSSFIALAKSVRTLVPPSKIKGSIEAKVLWATQGGASFTALIFESQLYHNLETVDDTLNMLIGCRRYNVNNPNGPMRKRVRAIQAAFQIRHTLSHNQGTVTQSDRAKFSAIGFDVEHSEVIDPEKDHLGKVIRDTLLAESKEFTNWVLEKTAIFLAQSHQSTGKPLPGKLKAKIVSRLGQHAEIDKLPWT
jgi:hypothetical protein